MASDSGADDEDEPVCDAGRQVPDRSHCHGLKAACAQTLEEMQEVSRYASGHNTAADAVLQRGRVDIQQQTRRA